MAVSTILAAVGLLAAGCGTDPPVELGLEEACTNSDYRDRDVIVEGTLGLPDSFLYFGTERVEITLSDGEDTIRVGFGTGPSNEANTARRLPDRYDDDDLAITTEDGRIIGVGARARITGLASPGAGCRIYVHTGEDRAHSVVEID